MHFRKARLHTSTLDSWYLTMKEAGSVWPDWYLSTCHSIIQKGLHADSMSALSKFSRASGKQAQLQHSLYWVLSRSGHVASSAYLEYSLQGACQKAEPAIVLLGDGISRGICG